MAKKSKTIAFNNATINKEDMTITEYNKDDVKTYSIKKLIEEWDGIDGISLTIKQDDDVPADE